MDQERSSARVPTRIKGKHLLLAIFIGISLSMTVMIESSLLLSQHQATAEEKLTAIDYSTQPLNATTLCLYLKQFSLSVRTKVSVCSYQGAVRIDIRRFIGERSTIRGIWLNKGEWRALLHLWGAIQKAVADAEPHM